MVYSGSVEYWLMLMVNVEDIYASFVMILLLYFVLIQVVI